jgi:hypothetical protein
MTNNQLAQVKYSKSILFLRALAWKHLKHLLIKTFVFPNVIPTYLKLVIDLVKNFFTCPAL